MLALPAEEAGVPPRFFTAEEARRILELAHEPFRIMFAVAAMTELRAGEVLALQRGDLDFDHGVIRVRQCSRSTCASPLWL